MIPQDKSKERKSDRILVLKIIDGEKAKTSTGLMDKKLFTGENKLHLVQDQRNCLWYFKYESGGLPPPLKQKFTTFPIAMDYVTKYLKGRNIEIAEVID